MRPPARPPELLAGQLVVEGLHRRALARPAELLSGPKFVEGLGGCEAGEGLRAH